MKVHLLEQHIDSFLAQQIQASDTGWFFPHTLVHRFHTQWQSLSDKGLKATYDECLRSDISSRWWKGDHYRPKEMMLELIEADSELAMIAWKDLQQMQASLEGRVSRFGYYCDQLLEIHRSRHIDSIDSWHHQDAAIISLYLAGLFPETYTLYPGLVGFQNFCKAVGSPDIPKVDDLERYMKVAKIVFTFLQKNAQFEKFVLKRNAPGTKIPLLPFQVTFEVIVFAGKQVTR